MKRLTILAGIAALVVTGCSGVPGQPFPTATPCAVAGKNAQGTPEVFYAPCATPTRRATDTPRPNTGVTNPARKPTVKPASNSNSTTKPPASKPKTTTKKK